MKDPARIDALHVRAPVVPTISVMVGIDGPSPSSGARRSVAADSIERPSPRRTQGAGATLERFLCLAATPTFAVAALYGAFGGDAAMGATCSAGMPGAHATGMVAMYALMSVFHATPWLRLAMRTSVPQERTGRLHG